MLLRRRYKAAATRFFARALQVNGLTCKIAIDQSEANTAGINAVNRMLKSFGCPITIEMVWIRYLHSRVEQDQFMFKKRVRPMLGHKSFASAFAMPEGIVVAKMIRKGQLKPGICPITQFAALAV